MIYAKRTERYRCPVCFLEQYSPFNCVQNTIWYRALPPNTMSMGNGNYGYTAPGISAMQPGLPQGIPLPPQAMYPHYPIHPPQHPHIDNYNIQPMPALPPPGLPTEMIQNQEYENPRNVDGIPTPNYGTQIVHGQQTIGIHQNGILISVSERPYYARYGVVSVPEEPNSIQYPPSVPSYDCPSTSTCYPVQEPNMQPPMPNMFVAVQHETQRNISPFSFDDHSSELPVYRVNRVGYGAAQMERRPDPLWSANNVFNFDDIRNNLPHRPTTNEDIFNVSGDGRVVGTNRSTVVDRLAAAAAEVADFTNRADDQELEEELLALERRIDTEFKNTD